jgi:hypothetical protein
MTQPTRIYKHSSAGTDWAALLLGAGLGLTLALQLTTVRKSDFTSLYASLASFSRLSALVGTAVRVGGQESAKWFGQPELASYKVFAVDRHEQTTWEI